MSHPCQDFVGGFDIVHRGQLIVKMDPLKVITFPQEIIILTQLANVSRQKNIFTPKYVDLPIVWEIRPVGRRGHWHWGGGQGISNYLPNHQSSTFVHLCLHLFSKVP